MFENLIEALRERGERITPVRTALLEIFSSRTEPFTPQELLRKLAERGYSANKTTVYRQLETLLRYGMVQEVHFPDRVTLYELTSENGHHHHLVCLKCQNVEDISFVTELEQQEKAIWKKSSFKVLQHSLEFFGICKTCQKKTR